MLIHHLNDTVLTSLTLDDFELIHPYMSYSEYIFRSLGEIEADTTRVMKYIDLGVRRYVSGKISTNGIDEYTTFNRMFKNEVVFGGPSMLQFVTNPYFVTVGIRQSVQENLEVLASGLPGLLRTFEHRLPQRFEKGSAEGKKLFTWMIHSMAASQYPSGTWSEYHQEVSMKSVPPPLRDAVNREMVNAVPWTKYFKQLFVVHRDPMPVWEGIGRVVTAMAAARQVPEEHVRKVLGV